MARPQARMRATKLQRRSAKPKPAKAKAARRYVFALRRRQGRGRAEMKDLLGGKGANLAEMANIGLPVPPGFTITTEVCTYYYATTSTYPAELKSRGRRRPGARSRRSWAASSATPRTRCSSPAAPAPASRCPA